MQNMIIANEELNKWCGTKGVNYYEGIEALGFLFKYAVPKLRINDKYPYLNELIIDPTICDEELYYIYLRYDSLHDDGCIEREEVQASDKDPALALFWAIYKVSLQTGNDKEKMKCI